MNLTTYVRKLVEGSLNVSAERGFGQRGERKPGAHMSSSGSCMLELYMKGRNVPQYPDPEGDRTKELGTRIHELMDETIIPFIGAKKGSVLNVTPFEVTLSTLEGPVTGTFDHLYICFDIQTILVIDHKSADPDSWFKKQKLFKKGNVVAGGPSLSHKMQVAGYVASDEIQALAKALGMPVEGFLAYINKSTLKPWLYHVKEDLREEVMQWWANYFLTAGFMRDTGRRCSPEFSPPAAVFCQYCSLFPPLPDKLWPNKTARQKALQERGDENMAACTFCDTIEELESVLWQHAGEPTEVTQ